MLDVSLSLSLLSLTPATSALDIGQHVERVSCHLDDGERLEIPVRWSVEGVATPRPARLFFFLSNFTEENRRKKLTLVGTATQAFRLVRVNSDNPAVVCTWDDESNNTNTDISIDVFY